MNPYKKKKTESGDVGMGEKEYEIFKMIENCDVGSICIDSYVKELVEQGKSIEDVTIDILHKGSNMTYRECCDTLNQLTEENKYLRSKINEKIKDETSLGITYEEIVSLHILHQIIKDQKETINKLFKENNDLINENTSLKYTPIKEFSCEEVQNALLKIYDYYVGSEKLDFHDELLIRNFIIEFQLLLFEKNGLSKRKSISLIGERND